MTWVLWYIEQYYTGNYLSYPEGRNNELHSYACNLLTYKQWMKVVDLHEGRE